MATLGNAVPWRDATRARPARNQNKPGYILPASIDLGHFLPYINEASGGDPMPRIKDFGGFQIWMYFEAENPPHFHVEGPDFSAKLRIDDLTVIAGSLRRWSAAGCGAGSPPTAPC